MFVNAGTRVYALDARTGELLWTHVTNASPGSGETTAGLIEAWKSANGIPNGQGVSTGDEMVFVGLMDGRVAALDQNTGKMRWSQQIGEDPPKKGQSVSAAPAYSNGVLYAGMANGDYHLRGRMVALDAKTGRKLWEFFTIPGPGETGHDTWPKDSEVWRIGGGGVWHTPAVDPRLGMVFFSVGNPVPQYAGEARAGDNLFTSSVVALDTKTGRLRWYYQVVRHDIWDADLATPVTLYEGQIDGRRREALALIRPDGYVFMLDRETGKPIFPVKEMPVPQSAFQKTAATQPFPVGADPLLPDCSAYKDKVPPGFVLGCAYAPYSMPPPSTDPPNLVAPGLTVRYTPHAYSPQTGFFYGKGTAGLAWRRRSDDPFYFGGTGRIPGLQRSAVLGAIDSRTNKLAWRKEMPFALFSRGGPLVTAGGLLFQLAADGNFQAFDARTGDQLWQFQTGAAGGSGSPSTYEIAGEQYVAIASGPTVWSFKLGGTLEPLADPELLREEEFAGPIQNTEAIETASLHRAATLTGGNRYFIDEYSFTPYRARVKAGASVTWTNNGKMSHTIVARNGAWTTGRILPTQEATVKFDTPGAYAYSCKEHPWSFGQLIVESETSQTAAVPDTRSASGRQVAGDATLDTASAADQATRGKALFSQHCSMCHGEDLRGGDVSPNLAGPEFLLRWQSRTVGELFDRTRTTMPQTSPGSLSEQAYLDVTAFLLQANDLPLAKEGLNTAPQSLGRVIRK